jgi:NhaA family Na+:H+ antiporter
MEIKREVQGGELADRRRAALPIAGALGGMIVPALIYAAFNRAGPAAHGWGIPMATDIAFSLGVLALLGPRVPRGLTVFLAALAIADDLGAVLVIALFYTSKLNLVALAAAFALAGLLALLARSGERRLWPFLIAAPTLWWCMHASGVHSTIAGVLLGWVIPLHADRGGAPLTTLEHALKPWVTWGVMPLFALANAGVVLSGGIELTHPVALGVGLGLLVGKPLGILGLSWLLVRLGWAKLPRGATWTQLLGVGMIAGIGFTVALFVSSLSFPAGGALEPVAKVGILTGSLLAAVLGTAFLARTLDRPAD